MTESSIDIKYLFTSDPDDYIRALRNTISRWQHNAEAETALDFRPTMCGLCRHENERMCDPCIIHGNEPIPGGSHPCRYVFNKIRIVQQASPDDMASMRRLSSIMQSHLESLLAYINHHVSAVPLAPPRDLIERYMYLLLDTLADKNTPATRKASLSRLSLEKINALVIV